jgi:putative membrane protein
MSETAFFEPVSTARATEVVAAIERRTSAEIVVAVRRFSGHYRHTDYLFGFFLALIALGVLLFHPQPFLIQTMPIDVAIAFALGAVFCARTHLLRRFLTSSPLMRANVQTAARAAFVELGVGATRAEIGILVYVSMFERRVEVVPDRGVDVAAMGPGWAAALAGMQEALRGVPDFERFLTALASIGPKLERILPCGEEDVNELPDQVGAR